MRAIRDNRRGKVSSAHGYLGIQLRHDQGQREESYQ